MSETAQVEAPATPEAQLPEYAHTLFILTDEERARIIQSNKDQLAKGMHDAECEFIEHIRTYPMESWKLRLSKLDFYVIGYRKRWQELLEEKTGLTKENFYLKYGY